MRMFSSSTGRGAGIASTTLNRLRSEGTLCDVVLHVEGKAFSAHKIILCSSSSYFLALFTSGWTCPGKSDYNMSDLSALAVELILGYIYTGQVEVTAENVEQLLPAATLLDIAGIVELCCCFLKDQLDVHNCIGILRYAQMYSCTQLRDHAQTFMVQNFEALVQNSPTQEFLEMSLAELCVLLDDDRLNVQREETLFEAILSWITYDPDQRLHNLVELLPRVRLGLMCPEYFFREVRDCPFLNLYQECTSIINQAEHLMKKLYSEDLDHDLFKNPLCRPRLPHDLLFTVGGWSEDGPTSAMETYDPRMGLWREVSCSLETPRACFGLESLGGFLYIIGGFSTVEGWNNVSFLNSVSRFDPLTKTWQEVAPMHFRRCYVSTVVMDGYIYALGGFDGVTRLNTAERYDPLTNQWTLIPSMHHKRSVAGAAVLNGKIYLSGGTDGRQTLFTTECYDPQSQKWTMVAPMNLARSAMSLVALNNKLFAIGGFDGHQQLANMEVYSPETDSWSPAPDMLHPRSNFGVAVMEERIYVVGGFNSHGVISKCELYDERHHAWIPVQDMNIRRSDVSCCVISGLNNVRDYTIPREDPYKT